MKKILLLLSLLLATNAWAETKADYLHCIYEKQTLFNYENLIKIQNYKALITHLNLEASPGIKLMDEWEKKAVEHTYDFIYMGHNASHLKSDYRLNRKTLVLHVKFKDWSLPRQCEIISKEKYNEIKENHKEKIKAHEKERKKGNKI